MMLNCNAHFESPPIIMHNVTYTSQRLIGEFTPEIEMGSKSDEWAT